MDLSLIGLSNLQHNKKLMVVLKLVFSLTLLALPLFLIIMNPYLYKLTLMVLDISVRSMVR